LPVNWALAVKGKNVQDHELLAALDAVQHSFTQEARAVIQKHPDWDTKTDERVIVFYKCCNVVTSTKLSLFFACKYLASPAWWGEFPHIQSDNRPGRSQDFGNFVKVSFIQALFSLTESAFRRFIRALDPLACAEGSAPFENIYQALLSRVTLDDKSKHIASLDVWREIRNAIHNNMVYYHRSGNNKTITYRGNQLLLEIDKPLNFVTWKLLVLLTTDIGTLITNIVRSPELSAVPVVYGPANFELGREPERAS
jgi:hypothetical protein